ncbi:MULTISPECIES: hypothetical protein [Spirosoma]|uniref:Uncharacterized protein n=1 Tax=Spirosoma liriopis TaxID=2937440 RepID=A0ABT0HJJ5_9BACT|nr:MULTISPECIES: hypothetical protein [Spirosoma]MCK8492334.1 hypothetical protein [Spirosoma liriopis]UHG91808.1 hypothetical protein LQ777_02655 [Spirosoma oryzicola]
MMHYVDTLTTELDFFQTKVTKIITQLYRTNVKDHKGKVIPQIYLAEEWEYVGQPFNALTEHGLAYIVNEELVEFFSWSDLDAESLIDVVRILEDKDFD